MKHITRTALVPFHPVQMYNLVNDIAKYPEFLPGCRFSEILMADPSQMTAKIYFEKAGISKNFTTRNNLITLIEDAQTYQIIMDLIDGPFKYLSGQWIFEAINNNKGCKVSLNINFEFANKLLDFGLGGVVERMSAEIVKAFTDRARSVYALVLRESISHE